MPVKTGPLREEKFDSIVVGGGISGTICAGYLQRYGQKTLLLERDKEIGGRATPVKFEGYTCDRTYPVLMTTWNGGAWGRAARELGANIKYRPLRQPQFFLRGLGNPPIDIPKCWTASAATDFLVSFVEPMLPEPLGPEVKHDFLEILNEVINMSHRELCVDIDRISMKDWVEARSSNPMVHILFRALAAGVGFMGEPTAAWEASSAGKMLLMIRCWMAGEGALIIGIPNAVDGIVKPFGDAFKALGGEIRTQNEVTEVIIEDGKAVGVAVKEKGKEAKIIHADRVVVSCAWGHIPKIFKKLPPDVKRVIKGAEKVKVADYWVLSGVKEKITDTPSVILIMDMQSGGCLGATYAQSIEQPWNAPPGKHLLWTFVFLTPEKQASKTDEELISYLNDLTEEVFPGFKNVVEVQRHSRQKELFNTLQLTNLPKIRQKSPSVEGLYFTGDATYPQYGSSFEAAASTGISTARTILGLRILGGQEF